MSSLSEGGGHGWWYIDTWECVRGFDYGSVMTASASGLEHGAAVAGASGRGTAAKPGTQGMMLRSRSALWAALHADTLQYPHGARYLCQDMGKTIPDLAGHASSAGKRIYDALEQRITDALQDLGQSCVCTRLPGT